MRKKFKKLKLNRETVRTLNGDALGAAVGRGETHEIITGCACTDGCGGGGGNGSGQCGRQTDVTCTCILPQSHCWCP